MSAPGFTPGPWYVTEAWGGFGSIKQADTDALIFGIAAGDTEEKQPDEVCEANARLIATAPELYDALAGLLEYVERFCAESSPTDAACEFASRVLAKTVQP